MPTCYVEQGVGDAASHYKLVTQSMNIQNKNYNLKGCMHNYSSTLSRYDEESFQ